MPAPLWYPSTIPSAAYPTWVKLANNLDYGSFSIGALTTSIGLFMLPGRGVIHGIKIKHTVSFAGPLISAFTISVGITSNATKYASAFDVFQAVSTTAYQLSSNFSGEDEIGPTQINVTATSVGANLSAATQGLVDIWALLSVISR